MTPEYAKKILFSELPLANNLWLFYQITDFGNDWEHLVVTLSPAFDGSVFYEENPNENSLTVFSTKPGNVSMQLTVHRYDYSSWPNIRSDQDDPFTHHILNAK